MCVEWMGGGGWGGGRVPWNKQLEQILHSQHQARISDVMYMY